MLRNILLLCVVLCMCVGCNYDINTGSGYNRERISILSQQEVQEESARLFAEALQIYSKLNAPIPIINGRVYGIPLEEFIPQEPMNI